MAVLLEKRADLPVEDVGALEVRRVARGLDPLDREPGTFSCTLADSSGQISPSSSLVRKNVGTRVAA